MAANCLASGRVCSWVGGRRTLPSTSSRQRTRFLLSSLTAYPERVRALKDEVLCYLRKPIDEQNLSRCLRAALTSAARLQEIHKLTSAPGNVNRNTAPRGSFGSAHSRPP